MKVLNQVFAMLIALQITPSISAPVSSDLIERQSQTSAQGDCTSQSVNGQPPTVSGNCAQGNTVGTRTSGGIPAAVGSGNRNTTSGGGTTGTSGGTLTGNTGSTTTGNRYGTTGSGASKEGSGGTTTGSTTGSGQGANGSDGVSNTKSLKSNGNTAFPLSDAFTNNLKGESFGNVALPQLDEIISSVQSEVPSGEIPGGDITATEPGKRDLVN